MLTQNSTDLNIRPKIITRRRKYRGKASWHWTWKWFLGYDNESKDNKSKNRQMGLHQTLKLCASKNTINRVKK